MAKIRIKKRTVDKLNAAKNGPAFEHRRRPCDRNGHLLHVGDLVFVYPHSGGRAKREIKIFYSDIENGLRLTAEAFGFVSWNGADVVWDSSPKLLADALTR